VAWISERDDKAKKEGLGKQVFLVEKERDMARCMRKGPNGWSSSCGLGTGAVW
jgi:hypothetical protein